MGKGNYTKCGNKKNTFFKLRDTYFNPETMFSDINELKRKTGLSIKVIIFF